MLPPDVWTWQGWNASGNLDHPRVIGRRDESPVASLVSTSARDLLREVDLTDGDADQRPIR